MKGRAIWLAVVATAMIASSAQAENFWSKFTDQVTKDVKDLTGAIKGGIEDLTQSKEDVEEIVEDVKELTGAPGDEPRYDPTWVAEAQQRLTVQGFDPGPIDGAFGNRTSKAITAFQRQAGISQDGLPRPSLMRALRARTQTVQIAQPEQPRQAEQSQWPPQAGATSGPASLPPPATAGTASFDTAPDPDYRTLLEMLMAANPEAFDSAEFALYYAALQLPPHPQRRCLDFDNNLGNEISRRQITEQAQAALGAVLAASPRTEQVGVFRIVTRETAQEYDFERGGFPIDTRFSHSPFRENWSYTSQRPQGVCSPRAAAAFFGEYQGHRIEVPIAAQGGAPLLVMTPDQAQGFVDRNRNRFFETEWLVEVHAVTGSLTGRVIAARAREPHGGPVLYEFDPALFQPPLVADPANVVPLSKYAMALHALHRIPDLLDQGQLLELTRIQIEADQRMHGPDYASTGEGMVPVFTAAQVEGRHAVLAAEELLPIYRQHLMQLAAAPPPRLRVDNVIGRPIYDSASGMLRCCEHQRRDAFALLGITRPTVGMPDSVQHRALYDIRLNNWDDKAPSVSVRDAIQRLYLLPAVDVVAFDRRLELEGIPSDRATAERLLLQLGQHQLTATVEFTVEDVRRELAQPGNRTVVSMFVRLDQVIISGPTGEVARLPAAAFPEALPPASEEPTTRPDPVAPPPSHDRLLLAYLASQPQLADDPAFAQRYATATDCEAWAAKRGDEFARADLADRARQRIRDALAQQIGQPDNARFRVSLEAEVGEYDFANQRFPLEVPVFDQKIYRNLLDGPVPALLIEQDGKACRRDSVASASFPDAFLLTLAGAKAIDSIGVPADMAAAKAFVQRELPAYRDPRAVRIEMDVSVSEILAPQRTHPQRDEHVSIIQGTVLSARILDAHSDQALFDYDPQVFDAGSEPATGPAPRPVPLSVPEGAEFVLVSVAEPADLEAYAVIGGSGLSLPKGERINGKFVLEYDETTDLWASLKGAPMVGIVLSAEQFARASGKLTGLDLRVEPYRLGGNAADAPQARPAAVALPVAPAKKLMADERGADEFAILNVTVGMTEPEVLAAVASEFSPDQVITDRKVATLLAERGPCNGTEPEDPAIVAEAGAFCLEVQLDQGTASRITLRQVVPGDMSQRALTAFRERYGEPAFEERSQPDPSVERSVLGWGRALRGTQLEVVRAGPDEPRTVLQGQVWRSYGVTVVVLRLDTGPPAQGAGSDSLAAGQEIKF